MTNKISNIISLLRESYSSLNPEALCVELGIPIVVCELPNETNGFLYSDGNDFAIIISNRLQGSFKKYCIAHEIGHYLLHQGLNAYFINNNTNLVLGKYEREADLFAAFLLLSDMPDTTDRTITLKDISLKTHLPISAVNEWAKFHLKKEIA